MTDSEEWWSDFKGPDFSDIATEFQYTKLAREVDSIDDIKVIKE